MSYIEIINNSEKYIEMLNQKDKIYIRYADIKCSDDLVKRFDPLFGYYDVKCFTINKKELNPDDLFLNYKIICGDFFCGEGYLKKIYKPLPSNEWCFNKTLVK